MASWDVDELESQLLFCEEDKDGIEAEIRKITGNRNIELLENARKDGLVAGRLEANGERWPCGDVGPMDMRGMVRIASLFERGSVLGFCDSCSDFYRLETKADGKVLAKRLTADDAYEALRWDTAPSTKQNLFDGALEETVEKRCWKLLVGGVARSVLAAEVGKLLRGECGKGVREDLGPDAESGADPLGNLDVRNAVAVDVAVYGRRSESRYRGKIRLGHAAGLEDR